MQKFSIVALSALFLPISASAQLATSADAGPFQELLVNILSFSNNVLIPFIIGIGFLVFVWGMFQYFILGGANDESKEKGRSLLVNATIGFVVIIIFWGVINLLTDSSGFAGQSLQNLPGVTPSVGG